MKRTSGGVIFYEGFNLYLPQERKEFAESLISHRFKDPDTLEIIKIFNKLEIQENDELIFLDLGASYGYWSLFLSRNGFTPIAVEGSSKVAVVGKINFILNDIPVENYLERWVIPQDERTYFKHETNFSFTNHINTVGNEILKNTCTLSELISIYKPTLLKLDLEGLDTAVLLNTDESLFVQLSYIVVEVDNGSDEAEEVKEFFFKLGFELTKVFGINGKIINDQSRVLANMHFVNQDKLAASFR
jgi:FkbM family methyltransferase